MKLVNRLVLTLITSVTLLASLSFVAPLARVSADAKADACAGVGAVSGNACAAPAGSPTAESLMITVINVLSLVGGFIAVIMIIIGGIRFVMSGGDANNTNAARNTILYAIVGLVIAALAQVLVHFVLKKIAQ